MVLLWAERAASYLKISVPCRGFATVLKDLKYADSHEWVKVEGKSATIGITEHAEDHLGEVMYVELPVVEVNKKLSDSPGLVNSSTYGELLCFMDPDAYSKLCEEEDASH